MSDTIDRAIALGYEIQHIFVSEIASQNSQAAINARRLLDSIGFDLDSRSNQIALLRS